MISVVLLAPLTLDSSESVVISVVLLASLTLNFYESVANSVVLLASLMLNSFALFFSMQCSEVLLQDRCPPSILLTPIAKKLFPSLADWQVKWVTKAKQKIWHSW